MKNMRVIAMDPNICLFEISWEVCNKVGGINTVLQSKLKEVTQYFGEHYVLIGPLLEKNQNFIEKITPFLELFEKILKENQIACRLGYWDTEEKPSVILVDFQGKYKIDELLYNLWNDFGVDSLASNYEYVEPILFSTASGKLIKTLAENEPLKNMRVITHFHEWLCGAGVLFIEKHFQHIPTVFTTHATVLGRALSGDKRCVYHLPETFDPNKEARIYGVFAKHSLERAAAQEADCFTTVSSITADEANIILNKYPDQIVSNGLNTDKLQQELASQDITKIRKKLIEVAQRVTAQNIPDNALLWVTSGRFEFHNKGYDILLSALSKLEKDLPQNSPTIVMFFLIAAKQYSAKDSLLVPPDTTTSNNVVGMVTHKIDDINNDLIVRKCNELHLRRIDSKVRIIYSNVYLDGADGVFDIPYNHVLAACDLSIFPSLYEPWGYTPLESITYGTPTITTNLSGFGNWIMDSVQDFQDAIYVLDAKCNNPEKISEELYENLKIILTQDSQKRQQIQQKAASIAKLADWKNFYKDYLDAYDQAFEYISYAEPVTEQIKEKLVTFIQTTENVLPRFRLLQHECPLPEKLSDIRDIAYNFWWTWNENSKILFKEMDPTLWEKVNHNPVHFLNLISSDLLTQYSNNNEYMEKYNHTLSIFKQYCSDPEIYQPCPIVPFSAEHPIAYFCMEYGIDYCLPIYSGGLGVLSGDYLKTISDMHIPMIAIGLFYKQGYFHQTIGPSGDQIAIYKTVNPNQIPMKKLTDSEGKTLLISIEILDKTIYCQIWEIKIGRIQLYLFDTDIPENAEQDRDITYKLYDSSRENRLKQEIILGIGGTRLIIEKLNITPSIYHLNESHCAFLLLERIKQYCHQGLSFHEAYELVRCSSIFTTHTPVPAGNEVFSTMLIKTYFDRYAKLLGISIKQLLTLAYDEENKTPVFSMTILALRLTVYSNAVSQIHQKVSREMWQKVWPGFLKYEIPITNVTNGVHLATWLGPAMKSLYNQYLGPMWKINPDHSEIWEQIDLIPDSELWQTHQAQKEKLLQVVKQRIIEEYTVRNERRKLINNSLNHLNAKTLLIGLVRRMTAYKRMDLILEDKERLAQLFNNKDRPVVLLIAGKAHPSDTDGQALIKFIIETMRERIFKGRIVFLENYDMSLSKLLVQGTDVWLNTPLLTKEACGTSGMKAGMNGVLNFSIRDGWWHEIKSPIGFDIQSFEELTDIQKRNNMENINLLNTLEDVILPLYYENHQQGFNPKWVQKMKASIAYISRYYNTQRMIHEYCDKLYCPALQHATQLTDNDQKWLKILASWKQNIADRFNTVKIKNIVITGLEKGKITPEGLIKIKVLLFSGKLTTDELQVEFVLIKSDGHQFIGIPQIIPFILLDHRNRGILNYELEHTIKDTGFYAYAVRVRPYHPLLIHPTGAEKVYWG
jgi:phosphorylase/glycogen(starch) synthase